MINTFCKFPLSQCSRTLSAVAGGYEKADTVIRDAKLVNVCTREIIEHTDVAVSMGRIAMVGDCSHCIGENTKVIDAKGRYLAPAFMDGHIHVESSMLSVGEFAKATLPHGTSGIYMDPHEICNVLGFNGIRAMLDDARRTPLKAMLTTPSCVPAVPGFEDTGAAVGPEDIAESMTWKETVGLGEMMNFPGILFSDERTHAIVGATLDAGKTVTGHYSMPETGKGLNAYIDSGARCCHESTREEDALAKMRLGMYAMLREGSAWHDLKEVSKAVTRHEVDSRFACLITDDAHPHTLLNEGHLDRLVRRAVEEGIDPVTAIQMVTINVAQCFQMDHEMGSVTPSKCADLVLIDDLEKCHVVMTMIDGDVVAENGKMTVAFEPFEYPAFSMDTVHLDTVTPADFAVYAEGDKVNVRVIEIIPAKTSDYERILPMTVKDGRLCSDTETDVLKCVVFERHKRTGTKGVGFVKGFGIKRGAMAQTVAHDAHNLLVIGTNDEDMALAANTLIACGGGMVAVADGKVIGLIELPIAGLMSTGTVSQAEEKVAGLEKAWKDMGCAHPSPFMTNALIPLACLPELRLTNRGLVDCRTFSFVDLIVK